MTQTSPPPRTRVLVSHAGPRAFAPRARTGLRALGYTFVQPTHECDRPDLRIVDERHLDRIPSFAEEPDIPVVLLTGPRPSSTEDPRIAGFVPRPARLESAFAVFQAALEAHPRRSPRVSTHLPARIIRADHRWPGALLCISERGALLRSIEPLEPESSMNLQFALPEIGLIHVRAHCIGHRGGVETGVSFVDPSKSLRKTIAEYVSDRLTSHH